MCLFGQLTRFLPLRTQYAAIDLEPVFKYYAQ